MSICGARNVLDITILGMLFAGLPAWQHLHTIGRFLKLIVRLDTDFGAKSRTHK